MCWEVFVELWESLEEAPAPCTAPAPLAEGAEAPIAGVSAPKECTTRLGPIRGDFHANGRAAVPNGFRDVQRLGVHRQVADDGLIKAAVFAEGLQHARMRVGLGSKTARSWRSMHLVFVALINRMLPSTFYKRNHRIP